MTFKSLLLGSAAALVAVTGARAADAVIIPEPELVEYVRVCDMYGTGFFYIPGTETCLAISGYVRYEINLRSDNELDTDAALDIGGVQDSWNKRSDVRLNFDARNETELGTLRSYIRLGYDSHPDVDGDNDLSGFSIDHAYITLDNGTGVAMIGKNASWWDWGFGVDGDALVNFGPGDVGMVAYTINAGGFGWTLALEEDNDGDYAPDVIFDVDGAIGDFGLRAGLAYNESNEALSAKIYGSYDFGVATLGVGYQYSDDNDVGYYDFVTATYFGPADYMARFEHVFGADLSADLTDRLSARIGFNYGLDMDVDMNGDMIVDLETDAYSIGGGINYELVEGFDIDARIRYLALTEDLPSIAAQDDGVVDGRIRFTRSF